MIAIFIFSILVIVMLYGVFSMSNSNKQVRMAKNELSRLMARQKQHEDDLNGVIVNQETGQTAEEVEFGIFPKQFASKQINKTEKDDDIKVEDRFEILDL